jgi:predicted DNA-binding transcriptional regulator YafY
MRYSDRWAISMEYVAADGKQSQRYVSPIKWSGGAFVALCLSKGEPRQFKLAQCHNVQTVPAESVLIGESPQS